MMMAGSAPHRYGGLHDGNSIDSVRRKKIIHLLEEQPGLSIDELADAFNISRGTIRHHLQLLIRQGNVAAYRQGNRRLHFTTQMSPMRRKAIYLLRIGSIRSVVNETVDYPRFRLSQVAQQIGLSPRSVRRALQMLEKAGLIEWRSSSKQKGVREVVFHPELRVAWALYIKDAGRAEFRAFHKHPSWFLGIGALLGKLAVADRGS